MTTKDDIRGWFAEGVSMGAEFMIVACDTFSHDDYPVYVYKNEDLQVEVARCSRDMQKVMEVYNLNNDRESQIAMKRCRADLV